MRLAVVAVFYEKNHDEKKYNDSGNGLCGLLVFGGGCGGADEEDGIESSE
ncbi:MAG: hypothetical protein IT258_08295 [Saprospiraceae bacterium]|nr:hypothetical protein [Saprospiraceae bacterium]